MNYEELRETAKTGDVILHAGNTMGSKFLRMATASQYSHVGLLVWKDKSTLWLAEMKPDTGYTLTPASTRIKEMVEHGVVRYGAAPEGIDRERVKDAIELYRDGSPDRKKDPAYSFPSAVIVWFAQWVKPLIPIKYLWLYRLAKRYAELNLVCSTLVQKIWNCGNIMFYKPADPEDIARKVETLIRVDMS